MKRIAAALPLALAAAAVAAPAVSSAAGKAPAVKQPLKMQLHIGGHDGPCPFASTSSDV
jgi:hypothetical protein